MCVVGRIPSQVKLSSWDIRKFVIWGIFVAVFDLWRFLANISVISVNDFVLRDGPFHEYFFSYLMDLYFVSIPGQLNRVIKNQMILSYYILQKMLDSYNYYYI